MNGDYVQGHQSELDHKTTGRWSRQEHEKFIVGKFNILKISSRI